ncbi:hypothetical protein [Pseudomonas monteilii]|uniref:hypothetical protein n=1 Tax=Pseudomonas monteilii TaxID=76759 RepID=UPI0015F7B715|nr:hypothetical protein [Pseudomonas monteilii]MBA6101717.1 hypothetical protein [Pseudomonas monteilii]
MPITVPDLSWYQSKSSERNAPTSCPYANVHKCPRYYASIYMLGEARVTTSISDNKVEALDAFWKESGLLPVIEEEDTGISGSNGKTTSFSNFCPEVSFTYFNYYASYLGRYVDETDKDCGHRTAERENIPGNWRYEWGFLTECHYLDCAVYNKVEDFNSKGIGRFERLAHSNIVVLIGRMEQCLEKNDPAGVLHAAANILETTAKDIIKSDSVNNQTLGSFIDKYTNESSLPENIKSVVGKIYSLRNTMPLSGHGSTQAPSITMQDAVVIAAATKFIVEVEYRMAKI